MKIFRYDEILSEGNIKVIEAWIAGDGVMIYPTDTLYGLGGNFYSPMVINKIDKIKNRVDTPYSVMIPGLNMLEPLVDSIPDIFYVFYRKLLPGKFTFLFNVSKTVDPSLVKGSGKIGVRIPNAPAMLKLMEIINKPLVTTSVNRTGDPPINDSIAITREFPGLTALLIDGGVLPESKGSTILDITETPVKCIRKGDDFELLKDLGVPIV
jgi:L-threonylcarbamoyladenylate synthase